MKLYDYILENFEKDEPFFVSELNMPGSTKNNIRQALKVLCDKGFAIRYDTGVYYIPKDINKLLLFLIKEFYYS